MLRGKTEPFSLSSWLTIDPWPSMLKRQTGKRFEQVIYAEKRVETWLMWLDPLRSFTILFYKLHQQSVWFFFSKWSLSLWCSGLMNSSLVWVQVQSWMLPWRLLTFNNPVSVLHAHFMSNSIFKDFNSEKRLKISKYICKHPVGHFYLALESTQWYFLQDLHLKKQYL